MHLPALFKSHSLYSEWEKVCNFTEYSQSALCRPEPWMGLADDLSLVPIKLFTSCQTQDDKLRFTTSCLFSPYCSIASSQTSIWHYCAGLAKFGTNKKRKIISSNSKVAVKLHLPIQFNHQQRSTLPDMQLYLQPWFKSGNSFPDSLKNLLERHATSNIFCFVYVWI